MPDDTMTPEEFDRRLDAAFDEANERIEAAVDRLVAAWQDTTGGTESVVRTAFADVLGGVRADLNEVHRRHRSRLP